MLTGFRRGLVYGIHPAPCRIRLCVTQAVQKVSCSSNSSRDNPLTQAWDSHAAEPILSPVYNKFALRDCPMDPATRRWTLTDVVFITE